MSALRIKVNPTPNEDAAVSTERRRPALSPSSFGWRTIATLATSGAIALSKPSHLPPIPSSKLVNPVMLPPGLPKLWTKPLPTGSLSIGDTIGTVRVNSSSALVSVVL